MTVMQYEAALLLRCSHCNKSFERESTYKRHGYYCRSRRDVPATNKVRSCVSCAKNKQRCDSRPLGCTRCISKGIQCQYPASSRRTGTTTTRTPITGDVPEQRNTDNYPPFSDISDQSQSSLLTYSVISDANLSMVTSSDSSGFDFDNLDLDLSFFTPIPQHQAPIQTRAVDSWGTSLLESRKTYQPTFSIPPTPSTLIDSLTHRTGSSPSFARTSSLIRSILRSYPLMLSSDPPVLPPFIHPALLSGPLAFGSESLKTCIKLLMLRKAPFAETGGKLFWENVATECERVCAEVEQSNLNSWEVMSALQALFIYLLIRLDEGEKSYNRYEGLLVKTVINLSKSLSTTSQPTGAKPATPISSSSSSNDNILPPRNTALIQTPCRESFIYRESIRRLCTVYQVINLLIYFSPAYQCCLPAELLLAPLPCHRSLWEGGGGGGGDFVDGHELEGREGREGDEGRDGTDVQEGQEEIFGMTRSGELVKTKIGHCSAPGDAHNIIIVSEERAERGKDGLAGWQKAEWEEWCMGMDGFGSLVMLAASLVS